jgi:hypothetical protein
MSSFQRTFHFGDSLKTEGVYRAVQALEHAYGLKIASRQKFVSWRVFWCRNHHFLHNSYTLPQLGPQLLINLLTSKYPISYVEAHDVAFPCDLLILPSFHWIFVFFISNRKSGWWAALLSPYSYKSGRTTQHGHTPRKLRSEANQPILKAESTLFNFRSEC